MLCYSLSNCENNDLIYEDTKDTVLIIDEIQENENLFTNIRTFNRCPGCDLIVTGSNLQRTIGLFQPAGDLAVLRMYPLSYEEYLTMCVGLMMLQNLPLKGL